MDIQQVLNRLDTLFSEKQIGKVEPFLQKQISVATEEGDVESLITLLNESIGFYRDTSQYDKAMSCCSEVKEIMEGMGLQGTVPYATTLLNIANAARAAGRLEEAMSSYAQVFEIYDKYIEPADFRYASLYNNLSLLYQEMNDFERASQALERALEIVVLYPEARIELATTHTNLAASLLRIGQNEEAEEHLHAALQIFEEDDEKDYHYSAALSAMSELMFQKREYKEAEKYVKCAMSELESHVGQTESYWRLSDNLELIHQKMEAEEQMEQLIENGISEETLDALLKDMQEGTPGQEEQKTLENQAMEAEQPDKDEQEEIEKQALLKEQEEKQEALLREQEEKEKQEALLKEQEEKEKQEVLLKEQEEKEKQEVHLKEQEEKEKQESLLKEQEEKEKQEALLKEQEERDRQKKIKQQEEEKKQAVEKKQDNDYEGTTELEQEEQQINRELQEQQKTLVSNIQKMLQEEMLAADETALEEDEIQNGMQLAKAYYEKYGKGMLAKFPQLKGKLAVGLVGSGSECFGFDDTYSRDHDFGPGFCIWLGEEDYEQYGASLQKAYDALPKSLIEADEVREEYNILTIKRQEMPQGKNRVGVMKIYDFYEAILGVKHIPFTDVQWLQIPEELLATSVNGCVFMDESKEFSAIRQYILGYYPEHIWRRKLAQELGLMAQMGQYNYARMLQRGDYLAADIQLADFMKHTMKAVYLLNKTYAPHDKWLAKGIQQFSILPEVSDMLEALHTFSKASKNRYLQQGQNQITRMIKIIADLFVSELKKQKLTNIDENYLGVQAEIVSGLYQKNERRDHTMKEQLVDEVVALEWKAFDQVKNEGGRADCQDDWNTFSIMRKSQYLTWNEEMLTQFRDDFIAANEKGWNLITEKYARMMESTAKEEYEELKDRLPVITAEKKAIMEQIIQIQIGWMEDFAKIYPYMAVNARTIHTNEDTPFQTSYETYLRGEIGTYSDMMLELYGRFIVGKAQQHENLAKEIMSNTARLYGYESLEEAEKSLQQR